MPPRGSWSKKLHFMKVKKLYQAGFEPKTLLFSGWWVGTLFTAATDGSWSLED